MDDKSLVWKLQIRQCFRYGEKPGRHTQPKREREREAKGEKRDSDWVNELYHSSERRASSIYLFHFSHTLTRTHKHETTTTKPKKNDTKRCIIVRFSEGHNFQKAREHQVFPVWKIYCIVLMWNEEKINTYVCVCAHILRVYHAKALLLRWLIVSRRAHFLRAFLCSSPQAMLMT